MLATRKSVNKTKNLNRYTFQDVLIAEHMKPCMHILEKNISSLNHVIVRPTKTPKSADKKGQFLTFKVNFLCQKLSESFQILFSLKNINLGSHFLLLTFFDNINFSITLFSKMMSNL